MNKLVFILLSTFILTSCQVKPEQSPAGLISGHVPVANSFTATYPSASIYTNSDVLHFKLTFPYTVSVTGNPRLKLDIGGTTAYADLASGSGSTILTFNYTVGPTDNDLNGIGVDPSINLNGATLTFSGTNGTENCALAFAPVNSAGIIIDNSQASIVAVLPPDAGTYYLDSELIFVASFTKNVTVTNSPRLKLTVGATTYYADYVSGSGSKFLSFKYKVLSSHKDTDGIAVSAGIETNGGTIKDSFNQNALLSFSAFGTAVKVDGGITYVTQVTPPVSKVYGAGENLDFIFTFNKAVTVTGIPTLALTVGSAKSANYHSGSGTNQLTFRYAIQPGDVAATISSGSIFGLSGATIRVAGVNVLNSFTVPSLAGISVADNRPAITSFQFINGTYFIGKSFTVTALFNQVVTVTGVPRIPITLDIGGVVYATYVSGSGTSNLIFSYTVTEGVNDSNGVTLTSPLDLNSGTIRNASAIDANLVFTSPSSTSFRVDGIRPTVLSVIPPDPMTYVTSDPMFFKVNFSEPVTVGNSGNAKLKITVGATTRQASYFSGSNTSLITFRYLVDAADQDSNGIEVEELILLSTAYINDVGTNGNTSVLDFDPLSASDVLVNVTTPSVASVSPVAAQTYKLADTISFVLNYSENVNVTGTPRFPLSVGGATVYATYASGSGSQNLVFNYTVGAGDFDDVGITSGVLLENNGGSVKSLLGVASLSDIPSQDLTGVFVDGIAPTIIANTKPNDKIYHLSDTSLSFTVTWNDVVTKVGSPRLVLTIGSTTKYAEYTEGDGTNTFTFVYPLTAADLDLDGLAISNNIDLNGGEIIDNSGNDADLSIGAVDVSKVLINYDGLASWWDIDDSAKIFTSVCGAGSCTDQVADRSSSVNDLTAAGAARPLYVSSGFGGGNRAYLQFNNTGTIMGALNAINPAKTVFIVFQTEFAAMTTQDIFYQNGLAYRVRVNSNGSLSTGATATYSLNGSALSSSGVTFTVGMPANSPQILAVQYGGNNNWTLPKLGAANFGGKVAEVLVYTTVLSATEIQAIVQYLNTKHAVFN